MHFRHVHRRDGANFIYDNGIASLFHPTYALKTTSKGEEVMNIYSFFESNELKWNLDVLLLPKLFQSLCRTCLLVTIVNYIKCSALNSHLSKELCRYEFWFFFSILLFVAYQKEMLVLFLN